MYLRLRHRCLSNTLLTMFISNIVSLTLYVSNTVFLMLDISYTLLSHCTHLALCISNSLQFSLPCLIKALPDLVKRSSIFERLRTAFAHCSSYNSNTLCLLCTVSLKLCICKFVLSFLQLSQSVSPLFSLSITCCLFYVASLTLISYIILYLLHFFNSVSPLYCIP